MTWEVAEQIVHENATGLRLEFDAGQPGDNIRTLRIFTKERTRVVVLMFQAGGGLVKSDVRGVRDGQLEDVGQAAFAELHQDPAVADAAARASADLSAHQGDRAEVVDVSEGAHFGEEGFPARGDPTARPGVEEEPIADEAPKQQGVFYGG